MSAVIHPSALHGKIALVTGAGSGIGRASARAFAAAGTTVVVSDISPDGGEETLRQIREAGGEATFIRTDVSHADEVALLIDRTVGQYSRLDYAHNNAGIYGGLGSFIEYPEDMWDRVIDVNLKGVWLCMKQEIIQMLEQGGGAIVNTSSIRGLAGGGGVAYSASKHGVIGLTKTAAVQYAAAGIRVNAVCPGFTETPMIERVLAERPGGRAQMTASQPLGRLGTPEEIAQAVIWLCSDAASFVTGEALAVDGGFIAQ
jgi:NAD(P)-dependent dehydrogenase (short-subunit alcohol dehydrogenase family)